MQRSPSNHEGPSARTATNGIGGSDTQTPSSKASITTGGYDMLFSRLTKVIKVTQAQGGFMRSSTPDAGVEKELLSNVSGQAKSGELTAVMGPSGSGKTTLLDCLAGRGPFQSGHLTVDGSPPTKDLKRSIAYVKQADLFFGHLTIRDQLTYTALLRLPRSWSKSRKIAEVDAVVTRLHLHRCVDTPIMLVSGGERKRTNIGTELLTNPRILILDEPTSGLDSTSAMALVDTLKHLAHQEGRTVITSIHQPSSSVFASFDSLLLLALGHVVYAGAPTACLPYLDFLGMPCPTGYNAADHVMDLLVVDDLAKASTTPGAPTEGGQEQEEEKDLRADGTEEQSSDWQATGRNSDNAERSESNDRSAPGANAATTGATTSTKADNTTDTRGRMMTAWDREKEAKRVEAAQEAAQQDGPSSPHKAAGDDRTVRKYEPSWWTQFTVLMHRSLKNGRSKLFTPINFVKSILLSLVVGLCWFQMDHTEEYVNDRSGLLFFSMTYWVFDAMFNSVLAFPTEKAIVDRERSSGSYQLSAYFLAKTCSELPCRLLLPCLYSIIVYWMASLRPGAWAFFGFIATILFAMFVGESVGLLIGATVPDFESAITAMTIASLALFLTGGYFVQNIPVFFSWIRYLSPFNYGYSALIHFEFQDSSTPCDGSAIIPECNGLASGSVPGEDIIDLFEAEGTIGFNLGLLVVLFVVVRLAAYFALRYNGSSGARI